MTSPPPTNRWVPAWVGRRVVLFFVAVFLPMQARAIDEFAADFKLLRLLNRLGERGVALEMSDYAELQADAMLSRYPDKRDQILVEKALSYYNRGKRKPADDILAGIGKESPFYTAARLLTGTMAFRRRDYEAAAAAYAEYFSKTPKPASTDPDDVDEFKRAVRLYSRTLEQQGQGQEAAKVMSYLDRIEGEGAAGDRQLAFLKIQSLLAAEEEKSGRRQPVDANALNGAIKGLKELQWQGLDGVAAAAFAETARAHILLGEYDTAIDVLKVGGDFMAEVESVLAKEGNAGASPLAAALYYYGKALKGKALTAFKKDKKADAREALIEAAKRFYKVAQDYSASPYRTDAYAEFGKCRNLLDKEFDTQIKALGAGADQEIEIKLEEAAALLAAENYKLALPIYLEALRVGRRSRRLPEVGVRFIICCGKLGRFLEAEAVASYLLDLFPTAEETADALLKLGALIYQKGMQEDKGTERDRILDRAMRVWDAFVQVNPAHPKAADIAYMIAENQYRMAADIAKQAETATGQEKEDIKAAAREAYGEAVPKYQRLIDEFGSTQKGVRALYKLGWVYHAVDQPREAADAFLRYCASATDPDSMDDVLEAKFRAAERLMLSDAPAEAVEHFVELLAWLQPDAEQAFNRDTETAKRIKVDAASYLAWAYDLAGEVYRPELTEFGTRADAARDAVKIAKDAFAEADRQRQQAEKDIERAKAQFEDLKRAAADTEQADTVTAPAVSEEEAKAQTAEEKETARRLAAERATRLAADRAKRRREQLTGERLAYEAEHESIKEAKDATQGKREQLEKTLTATETKLAALKDARAKGAAEHEQITTASANAQKAVADADAEVQKLQTLLEKAKEWERSGDAEKQQKGAAARRQVATLLQAAQAKLDQAHAAQEKVVTPEAEAREAELLTRLREQEAQIAAAEEDLRHLRRDSALAAKEADLLQARLMAVAKALERNREEQKTLDLSGDARAAAMTALTGLRQQALDRFHDVMEKRIEKAMLVQTMAQEEMALAQQRIADAEARLAAVMAERRPVQASFDAWKAKAEGQFLVFLKQFSQSKHVPDNMARLGTIYLESRQFEKAAGVLAELAARYPDSAAGKDALFNLARAQCEIDEFEKAASGFSKLLDENVAQVPSPNLSYVSEKMLEGGHPEVSLAASRELLARSENPGREDYQMLVERVREPVLYRAGEACFLLEEYADALSYFEKIIAEKPNSALFFAVRFKTGLARRLLTPPDYEGARRDFSEILQYATDPVMINEGVCRLGETLVMRGGPENLRQGLARFQQVAMLADPGIAGNRPFIEMALYESAKAFARLGQMAERDRMVARYRAEFPEGRYLKELTRLPAPEFGAASAAGP